MSQRVLSPDNTLFAILSFEGPDSYSLAGGLGVRASRLGQALAGQGYETHHFFIGDPWLEGRSSLFDGRFLQHRWCQWISRYHPSGVYDGEEGKLNDFINSIPGHVVDEVVCPALAAGKQPVILAEEWHTAEALCRISDLLIARGIRERVLLLWNANNTYSFHRINWARLRHHAAITTVSRYMRHLMKPYGVEPMVIHNGIQPELTEPVQAGTREGFKIGLDADFILFKMARFDPAKGWMPAVETAARLKAMGYRVAFFLRGGIEPFGEQVLHEAASLGLSVRDVHLASSCLDECLRELLAAGQADVINIQSFISHDLSRVMFACSDAVMANSVHEPFGLVGLEAMASGGAAFVGMTGEDYAHDFEDAVVLETSKAEEAVASMLYLHHHRQVEDQLREQAKSTARGFTWERIIESKLLPKLERLSWERSVH
jgi:glycosyltransferase involved in cell wall biosynthesis